MRSPGTMMWLVVMVVLVAGRRVLGVLQLPGTAEPRWYRLELLPRTSEGWYSGQVRVNITCRADTDTLVLHADPRLHISASHIAVSHPSSRAAWSEPVSVVDMQRDPGQQLLMLILSRPISRLSSYSLSLHFEGPLGGAGEDGLIRAKYFDHETNNTEWYIVTNMTLDSARKMFPCFDEPTFKATFEVSVGTPSHQHVFSNMPLADIENVEGQPGWYWKHFSVTPPMSTFSVGVVVLEFEHFGLAEGSFHIVGPTSIEHDIETSITYLQDVYEYLQDYMDLPYPLLKLDIVFVPGVYREAAASWGLVVLGEDSVKDMDRGYLAREMATQWVGHLATPRWRREWLYSEGLAMHLGHQFLLQYNYETSWDRTNVLAGYERKNVDQQEESEADKTRYKVFRLLGMLQYSLTKKTFRAGLHRFLKSRKYRTFSEDDVWAALTSQARTDRALPQDMSVETVAESWLGEDRLPLLVVSRDYQRGTFTVTQRVFRTKKSPTIDGEDPLWYIPITSLSSSSINDSTAKASYWMKKQKEITIDNNLCPASFLIVNPAQTGMFLVNYDPTNWALLADALNKKMLPVAVRVKLLRDSWNLALAGEITFNIAMNMTLFLKDETEYAVWDAMHTMFDHVGRFLDGTRAGEKLKRYLLEQATSTGTMPTLLNTCGSPANHSAEQGEDWPSRMEKPLKTQTDKTCDLLVRADLADFHRAVKKISRQLRSSSSTSHENVTNCFSNCIRDSDKILRVLEMVILLENSVFTDADVIRVLNGVTRFYNGYKAVFLFLRQNFDSLSQIFEEKPDVWRLVVRSGTSHFTSEDGLQMVEKFYRDRRYELGAAESVVQASLDQIRANILWTKRNSPVIEHWLNKYFYDQETKQPHA